MCAPGSIAVEGLARVMELPTVFHLVTTVRGRLRPDVGLAELLRATFPGGIDHRRTKRRAMEIIEELEPCAAVPTTGATGWLGAAAIWTGGGDPHRAVLGERLPCPVGGGIVADSDPQAELAETEAKARAFRELC